MADVPVQSNTPSKFDIVKQWTNDESLERVMTDLQLRTILARNPELKPEYIIDFVYKCQAAGANPLSNEAYLVSHYDKYKGEKVGTTIFSIHFLIKKAVELYGDSYGGLMATYTVEEVYDPIMKKYVEEPVATATLYFKGNALTAKAYWSEYSSTKPIWKSKGRQMLQKCAKALVLRDNCPMGADTYVFEEMDKAIESSYGFHESTVTVNDEAKAQLPPEESEIGSPDYRFGYGPADIRNKKMADIPQARLEDYYDTLESRHATKGLSPDYMEIMTSIAQYLEGLNV